MPTRPTGSTGVFPLAAVTSLGVKHDPLEEEVVALFDQFRSRLLRFLLSFGLTIPDAEEVIQEVFLSLFQHLRGGGRRDSLRGWLFRVAHNMALKHRYRSRRNSEMVTGINAEDTAIDPGLSPEDQLVNNETERRLWAVVEAMPDQDRRCLLLRAEGLRYREIAGVLDVSLGAVSLSLARSLARITRSAKR